MPRRALLAVVPLALFVAALLAGCGQPRTVAQQGPVCESMAKYGQLPVDYPNITPMVEVKAEHARQLTRHYARQSYGGAVGAAAAPEPPAGAGVSRAHGGDLPRPIAC